ncbi:MAG: glycoside hydrolase family 3 C-terminal domain-containing protein [Bacteroidota bacterium]
MRINTSVIIYCLVLVLMTSYGCGQEGTPDYMNPDLPVDQRVDDLVSRMTVDEKILQMSHLAPAIERLNIVAYEPNFDNPLMTEEHPDYSTEDLNEEKELRAWENYEHWDEGGCLDGGWWNEALHGVARAGLATSFPQSIGLGSTWNPELIEKAMSVSSTEARVHHNVYGKKLTYWSPTINILRDPRWGRNEESYSEDPYLLSRMAAAFVKGFQGDDDKYLKAIATVKHYVANNSEYNRHNGSSDIEERWLREYYMPAFRAAIEESNAYSVMSAYNAVNGIPVSADYRLMTTVLRDEWGFEGYVVSDCGSVSDVPNVHKYETDKEKAMAMIVKAGLDLECETCESEQFMFDKYLKSAFDKGYVTEADLDVNVKRLFRARMRLGEFDPLEMVPYSSLTRDDLDTDEHRATALQTAREAMVLLKNDNRTLPLDKNGIKSMAVIGPNADIVELGGYSGSPSVRISPLEGIKNMVGSSSVDVVFSKGCDITNRREIDWDEENDRPIMEEYDEAESIMAAADVAKGADVAILFLGTNLDIANEAADRTDLELPGNQLQLAQEVFKANPNTIVVLINGMALSINWLDDNVPAILEAWYAGQAQGTAIAETLFGEYNPGGKLPVTFYKGVDDLPHLGDYDITKNRTYWFYDNEVLYPFGHGLSYSSFEFGDARVDKAELSGNGQVNISVELKNASDVDGEEVVQLYIRDLESELIQPKKKLRDFARVMVGAGSTETVTFTLDKSDFEYWSESKDGWDVEPGAFEIQLGNSSQNIFTTTKIDVK